MSNRAVFEVATLADACARAARIAPSKGSALDKAAGIVIDLHPRDGENVVIQATDLDVTYRQRVGALDVSLDSCRWRVPAVILAGFVGQLPMESGSQVTVLDKDDGYLYLQCGGSKMKLRQILGDFPIIEPFDPSSLGVVDNFAARLGQVSWAVRKKAHNVLAGVHMDGTRLIATDMNRLAVVPCEVPVDKPTTALLGDVSGLVKDTAEVRLGLADMKVRLMTDDDTQATATVLVGDFPKIDKILDNRMTDDVFTFDVAKDMLVSTLSRMLVLVKGQEFPRLMVTTEPSVLLLRIDGDDGEAIVEEVEIDGGNELEFEMTPGFLVSAVNASRRANVTVRYGPASKDNIMVTDDDGYQALIAARVGTRS